MGLIELSVKINEIVFDGVKTAFNSVLANNWTGSKKKIVEAVEKIEELYGS